jgi:hypothetical protein
MSLTSTVGKTMHSDNQKCWSEWGVCPVFEQCKQGGQVTKPTDTLSRDTQYPCVWAEMSFFIDAQVLDRVWQNFRIYHDKHSGKYKIRFQLEMVSSQIKLIW